MSTPAPAASPLTGQYLLVTGNYWAFTLTDGALRMLVVLHFHQLGYSPLQVAMLFLFYEAFGVVTNLVGGWLGARLGLDRTMNLGLALQVGALLMLAVPAAALTVPWVMAAQALSGVAKDLNKMSAKGSLKLLVPAGEQARLYRWVAALTGSKNALKGVGFFLGGLLLATLGFRGAVLAMAAVLALVWVGSVLTLRGRLGRASARPRFRELLSKSPAINRLSAARLFLFGARDVWFVVALPVFLADRLGWTHAGIGAFLAAWVIGYGLVQALAPALTGLRRGPVPDGRAAFAWALPLVGLAAGMAAALAAGWPAQPVLVAGLLAFGAVFALNSALHSYLIVSYAREDGVSLDVGFYYMANALGRLLGTVLSGAVYQAAGLAACLAVSAAFVALAALVSLALPRHATAAPRRARRRMLACAQTPASPTMDTSPVATADDRDLEHLRLLGIFHYVFAGFALLGLVFLAGHYWFMSSILDMAGRHPSPNPPPENIMGLMLGFYAVLGLFCVLGAVLNAMAGHGLRHGKRWTLCFVVACLNCLQVPLGTVLGVFTLLVLNRTGVRARFTG